MLRQPGERAIAVLAAALGGAGVDDDLVGGDAGYCPRPPGDHDRSGITGHLLLESGSDERSLRIEERHCLPLHVRSHQRAVGVVVLEERNERGGDGHELFGSDIHVVNAVRLYEWNVTALAAQHQLVDECAVFVQASVRLSDDDILFTIRIEPLDVRRDLAVLHHAIRRLDKAEVVDLRVAGKRRDESDVRTFRGLDRAHTAVLRIVNVADLEAGALTSESARSKRRQTTLVRQLRQRVRLIHELR